MNASEDAHLSSLQAKFRILRRAFVVGSLATGFALAVLPVAAETITTNAQGLVVGEVTIPVEGGAIPGYRAMPAAGGPFATIAARLQRRLPIGLSIGRHAW